MREFGLRLCLLLSESKTAESSDFRLCASQEEVGDNKSTNPTNITNIIRFNSIFANQENFHDNEDDERIDDDKRHLKEEEEKKEEEDDDQAGY